MTNNSPKVLIARVEWIIKCTLRIHGCNETKDQDVLTWDNAPAVPGAWRKNSKAVEYTNYNTSLILTLNIHVWETFRRVLVYKLL